MNKKWILNYFLKFIKKNLFLFIVLLLFILAYIGVTLYTPQIFKKFIDGISSQKILPETILFLAISYLLLLCSEELVKILRDFFTKTFSWKLNTNLRSDIFKNVLKRDITFYSKNSLGSLLERIDGDVKMISQSLSNFALNIFSNFIIFTGIIFIVFRLSILLGFVFLICSLVNILMMIKQSKRGSSEFEEERKTSAKITSLITEAIDAREILHILNAKNRIINKSCNLHNELYRNQKAFYKKKTFTLALNDFILMLEKTLLILSLFYLSKYKQISIGQIFMTYNYYSLLEWPLEMLVENATIFQSLTASVNRVGELYSGDDNNAFGKKFLDEDTYSVEFKEVSFAYDSREQVFDKVSFFLDKGQRCLLQGRTGAGKTTLIKLLLSLQNPSSGDILLNGISLQEYDKKSIAENISYVSQTITLFSASIRENLRLFDELISDEQIINALKKVGMYEKILSLPNQLNYICKENGENFSSGEMQLLACARLFLKESKIVILDEPSSKLDEAEEKKIDNAFNEIIKGKTAFIISHQNKTIENFDMSIFLSEGKIKIENLNKRDEPYGR